MRRGRTVAASTGKAYDFKPTRASTDGKSAKMGYDSDEPAISGHLSPSGTTGGSHSLVTSKHSKTTK